MNKNTLKSIWAVAAGVLTVLVVTTIVDIVLHLIHVLPPMPQPMDNMLALLAATYRVIIGIAAAYFTARLAPARPMHHAIILGYVGVALGLVGLAVTWDKGLAPKWYPIALVVFAIPQCWMGGRIWQMQTAQIQNA